MRPQDQENYNAESIVFLLLRGQENYTAEVVLTGRECQQGSLSQHLLVPRKMHWLSSRVLLVPQDQNNKSSGTGYLDTTKPI